MSVEGCDWWRKIGLSMKVPAGYVWVGHCSRCGLLVTLHDPNAEHDWLMRCNGAIGDSSMRTMRCDGVELEFESPLREICQAAYLTGGREAVLAIVKNGRPDERAV